MFRSIVSLLFVAALMLLATPGAEARFYVEPSEFHCSGSQIPANTPLTIKGMMENNTGENVIGLANGLRIYSPDGAVWQTPTYDTAGGLDNYFDFSLSLNGFSVDGSGADTVGLTGVAVSAPGVPNGYDDVVLVINTQVEESQIGKTFCIDSTWFPPMGSWQWVTPSGTVIPEWEGPHCWEVVAPLATIEGTVFYDADGNGVWDQPTETGMPGVTVNLVGTSTQSTTTGSNGEYSFTDLAAGTYRVYEDVPLGYLQTFPTSVSYVFTTTGYAYYTDVDFGNTDTTCESEVEIDTCFAGTDDDFVGAEPSSPDAALLATMGNAAYGANPYFDSACTNQSFGHTFSGCWPESCKVVGATLCMKLKATGSVPTTDKLYLGEWDEIGGFWSITLGNLETYAGGDGNWNHDNVMTVCLDLANLPATGYGGPQNLLGGLQDGRLDVLISDDTEVDYLELIVETCCDTSDTCYADGDVNNDGIAPSTTDLVDLIAFLNGVGPAPVPPYSADLNGDGIIDGKDVQVYKNYFIYGMSAFAPYGGYPVPCPCDPILAPATVYLESVSGAGARGDDPEVVAGMYIQFNIGLRNGTGSNLEGLVHGFRVYSPDGATWEPLEYGYHSDFPAESFFDVHLTSAFSNDGSGADTVGFTALATTQPGVPNGYDDVVLMVGTRVGASCDGDTICIDSSFYPPDGDWQWMIPTATVHPVWDGPHCFEVIEFPWDTVYSYEAMFTSLGSGALTLNPDSSVTVSGMGSTGEDGMAVEAGPSLSIELSLDAFPSVGWGGTSVWSAPGGSVSDTLSLDDAGCCTGGAGECANTLRKYCYETNIFHKGRECVDGACVWPDPPPEHNWWDYPCTNYVHVIVGMREFDGNIEVVPVVDDTQADYTLEVYSDGVLTFSTTSQVGDAITTTNVVPSSLSFSSTVGVVWPESVSITVPGGPTISGDEIHAVPLERLESAPLFSLVNMRGINVPEFTVTGVVTQSCCVGERGNVDYDPDDIIDISDLVYLVDYMFTSGPPPTCWEEANVDGNGPDDNSGIDISDLVYLVDYMFNQGSAPVPCGQSAPAAKVIGRQPDISFGLEYDNDISTVVMNSSIDLRGIQLELKGVGPAPANLVGEHVDMIHGRDGWVVKVGLLDLNGGEIISADTREVVRFEGKYTLEAVIVADVNARSITPIIGTALKQNELPTIYTLSQNYPNPFNPSTSISFALPEAAEVRLEVFNLLGQRVTTLLNQRLEAGNHTEEWDSQNELGQTVASGVYFYRLQTPRFTESKKMVLLK